MKYLSSAPFTVAVSTPKAKPHWMRHLNDDQRRSLAAKPHEYINSGVMCQLCGLGEQAKIHEVKG